MPAVKARYRTTNETAIIGESLAGLFVMETLFQAPELFDTYIAIDPSVWWNHEYLLGAGAAQMRTRPFAGKSLYVGVSGEPGMPALSGRLRQVLETAGKSGLRFELTPFPEESHATIYHPAALQSAPDGIQASINSLHHTIGGSVSRANERWLGQRFLEGAPGLPSISSAGSSEPSGSVAGIIALVSKSAPRAQDQDRLAVAILLAQEVDRLGIASQQVGRLVAVRHDHRVVHHRRTGFERDLDVQRVAVALVLTLPSMLPTRRGTAPSFSSDEYIARTAVAIDAVGHQDRHAAGADAGFARTAQQRQRRRRLVGSESARLLASGSGAGTSMPRPSATFGHQASIDVGQQRQHALAHGQASAPGSARSGRRWRCGSARPRSGSGRTGAPAQ